MSNEISAASRQALRRLSKRQGTRCPDPQSFATRERGMTLIEILVVLVLIGIVLGIVGGNFIGKGEKAKGRRGEDRNQPDFPDARSLQARDRPLPDDAGRPAGADQRALGCTTGTARTGRNRRLPKDPWGNEYKYTSPAQSAPYEISFARRRRQGRRRRAEQGHLELAAMNLRLSRRASGPLLVPRARRRARRHAARAPRRAVDHGDRGALVLPMVGGGVSTGELKGAARRSRPGCASPAAKRSRRAGKRTSDEPRATSFPGRARWPRSMRCRSRSSSSCSPRRAIWSATRSGAIRFFPDGGSNGGRLTLAAGERKFNVDVDWLTGRVAILE